MISSNGVVAPANINVQGSLNLGSLEDGEDGVPPESLLIPDYSSEDSWYCLISQDSLTGSVLKATRQRCTGFLTKSGSPMMVE